MRRLAFPPALAIVLAFALASSGCQQLFTTSLGAALARDEIPIPSTLSVTDAADLAAQAQANQDTKLATALVASLNDQIAGDVAANTGLAAAAASAAVVASNAGSSVLEALDSFMTGGTPDSATISALVAEIQAGATADVITALKYLDPTTGIADSASVSGTVGATDYAIAAIVLAASALPAGMDPTTLSDATTPTLSEFRADPDVVIALSIIDEAANLATDAASQDLLNQLSEMMIPPP
jgi:hypothetical protein